MSAALEATPGHDGASQSQHQPGAKQAFDAAAHMRRVSVQQQANSKDARVAERAAAEIQKMGISRKRTSAADYRAARRASTIGASAVSKCNGESARPCVWKSLIKGNDVGNGAAYHTGIIGASALSIRQLDMEFWLRDQMLSTHRR